MIEGLSTVLPCSSYFRVWLSFIFRNFKNTLASSASNQTELPFCLTSFIQSDIVFMLTDYRMVVWGSWVGDV